MKRVRPQTRTAGNGRRAGQSDYVICLSVLTDLAVLAPKLPAAAPRTLSPLGPPRTARAVERVERSRRSGSPASVHGGSADQSVDSTISVVMILYASELYHML